MNPKFTLFDNNLKLCYCKEGWAWFTTCSLDKQWGDDWNDAPWEHNAGYPYVWAEYRKIEPYNVVKVAWEGPFILPDHEHINSPYSVEMINRGDIAWLRPDYYTDAKPIHAGIILEKFIKRIEKAEGAVYLRTPLNSIDTRNIELVKENKQLETERDKLKEELEIAKSKIAHRDMKIKLLKNKWITNLKNKKKDKTKGK